MSHPPTQTASGGYTLRERDDVRRDEELSQHVCGEPPETRDGTHHQTREDEHALHDQAHALEVACAVSLQVDEVRREGYEMK